MVFALMPVAAQAGMAGIGNAQVDEDVFTLQWRNAYITDSEQPSQDGRWRSRMMFDYGVTNDYAVALHIQTDKRPNDALELDALIFQQRVEYHNVKDDGFYSGFWLRYTWKDGDKKPDDAHIRLIWGMPIGNFEVRLNQILGWEVGQDSRPGLIVDTRGQYTYAYMPNHRIGFEHLNNFGNTRTVNGFSRQNHEIGPMLSGKFDNKVSYELGYRHGISDQAADHTIRLFLWRGF